MEARDEEIAEPIRPRVCKKEAFLWSSDRLSFQESPHFSRSAISLMQIASNEGGNEGWMDQQLVCV